MNKKVLLRERKRHTARCRVVTTHSVVLSWLIPPPPAGWTDPPSWTWPPPPAGPDPPPPPGRLDLTPSLPTGLRTAQPPRPPWLDWPDQPTPLWTDKHLWKQYLPVVLRTRAVIMYLCQFGNLFLCTKFQSTSSNYYLYYICTNTSSKIIEHIQQI